MFDDPQKELQRLEKLLLEEEPEEPTWEVAWENADEELDEIRALLDGKDPDMDQTRVYGAVTQTPSVRNYANGYGASRNTDPADVDLDAYSDRVYDEPQEKSNRGLVILAVLETLGIAALVAYWVLVLL